MTTMKILTTEAIQFLNKALCLPATGHEQDWEIELADPNRIDEFILFYENGTLNADQRSALMALIIASLEDLAYIKPIEPMLWERISGLLSAEPDLHRSLIDYWSLNDERDSDDVFAITKLMRSLKLH
jgi:hypothetical protein